MIRSLCLGWLFCLLGFVELADDGLQVVPAWFGFFDAVVLVVVFLETEFGSWFADGPFGVALGVVFVFWVELFELAPEVVHFGAVPGHALVVCE